MKQAVAPSFLVVFVSLHTKHSLLHAWCLAWWVWDFCPAVLGIYQFLVPASWWARCILMGLSSGMLDWIAVKPRTKACSVKALQWWMCCCTIWNLALFSATLITRCPGPGRGSCDAKSSKDDRVLAQKFSKACWIWTNWGIQLFSWHIFWCASIAFVCVTLH